MSVLKNFIKEEKQRIKMEEKAYNEKLAQEQEQNKIQGRKLADSIYNDLKAKISKALRANKNSIEVMNYITSSGAECYAFLLVEERLLKEGFKLHSSRGFDTGWGVSYTVTMDIE